MRGPGTPAIDTPFKLIFLKKIRQVLAMRGSHEQKVSSARSTVSP